MKTIYLKSSTKSGLIVDISSVIEGYDGAIEFSNGTIHGHWIGKIPATTNPETGDVLTWLSGWHANILAPDDFDASVFSSQVIPPPSSPVHQFA